MNRNLHTAIGRPATGPLPCAAAGWVVLAAALLAGPVAAQTPAANPAPPPSPSAPTSVAEGEPIPEGASADRLPDLRVPDLSDLRVSVPRPVRAASAALGMGRARLALVVGIGTVDGRSVVDAAGRDAAAVAAALRAGGFVVMAREELGAQELRDNLREFRERLQPGSIGFLYVAALGAQVDGQNLLLPRDARLPADGDAQAVAEAVRRQGVPLAEVIDAVMGTPDSPRLLVVDAAHAHPALARLPQPGLAEPRLPPGTMALFASAPGAVQEVAAVAPLPDPAPADPRELAATPFARTLTAALLNPRASGPDVLRQTRHALFDGSAGRINPWLGGQTDDREELAEAQFLDLLPRTPDELGREAARQIARTALRAGRAGSGAASAVAAGDMAVSEVLEQNPSRPGAEALRSGDGDSASRLRPDPGSTQLPGGNALGAASGAAGGGGALAGAAGVAGAAASVAGTAAGAAVTAAGAAATTAIVASAAAGAATTAAGAAGTVVANAAALGARVFSGGAAEAEAARTVAQGAASASASSAPARALSAGSGNAAAAGAPAAAVSPATAAPAAAAAAVPAAAPVATPAATSVAAPVATPVAAPVAAPVAVPATPAAGAAAVAEATGAAATPAGAAAGPATPPTAVPPAPGAAGPVAPGGPAAGPAGGAPARVLPAEGDLPVEHFAGRTTLPPAAAPALAAAPAATAAAQALPAVDGAAPPGTPPVDPASAAPAAPQPPTAAAPVHIPRVNPYGYTEGDTFTYQVLDTWRNEVKGTYVQAVESVAPDGRLLGNADDLEFDPQGRLRRQRAPDGTLSLFEPAQELWWPKPKRGEQRGVRFRETYERDGVRGQIDWVGTSTVGRAQTVRTPAGAYEAVPIESSGLFSDSPGRGFAREGRWTRTVWYSEQLGHPVAIDLLDRDMAGVILRRERVELLNAQSSRGQP
jgi:hypothetical protein